jgi:hypothetical protein
MAKGYSSLAGAEELEGREWLGETEWGEEWDGEIERPLKEEERDVGEVENCCCGEDVECCEEEEDARELTEAAVWLGEMEGVCDADEMDWRVEWRFERDPGGWEGTEGKALDPAAGESTLSSGKLSNSLRLGKWLEKSLGSGNSRMGVEGTEWLGVSVALVGVNSPEREGGV